MFPNDLMKVISAASATALRSFRRLDSTLCGPPQSVGQCTPNSFAKVTQRTAFGQPGEVAHRRRSPRGGKVSACSTLCQAPTGQVIGVGPADKSAWTRR